MVGVRLVISYEGDQPAAQISALVTKTEYRGKNIGQSLVKYAENWARQHGSSAIFLNSGNRPEREDAHQFYKHLGYTVTGYRFSKSLD